MAHIDNQLHEGAILFGVFRYTMTIPEFYIVTRVTPTGCKVIELHKRMVRSTDGGYNQMGYEIPCLPVPTGGKVKQARYQGNGEWKMGTGYDAVRLRLWNGQPVWANYCD